MRGIAGQQGRNFNRYVTGKRACPRIPVKSLKYNKKIYSSKGRVYQCFIRKNEPILIVIIDNRMYCNFKDLCDFLKLSAEKISFISDTYQSQFIEETITTGAIRNTEQLLDLSNSFRIAYGYAGSNILNRFIDFIDFSVIATRYRETKGKPEIENILEADKEFRSRVLELKKSLISRKLRLEHRGDKDYEND